MIASHAVRARCVPCIAAIVAACSAARAAADPERVRIWRDGRPAAETTRPGAVEDDDLLLLDLGEAWVPYLLSGERTGAPAAAPHGYRERFAALARGLQPEDAEGERARGERYLESYGIPPTLGLLRDRLNALRQRPCASRVDPGALGPLAYLELDEDDPLPNVQQLPARVRHAIDELRFRLQCEGHLRGRARKGTGLDEPLRAALAEFERRHRIYARGTLSQQTLAALEQPRRELARRSVVRALTERAMLGAGTVEDGSVSGPAGDYRDAGGRKRSVRNLEAEMRERIVRSFGLQTFDSTLRWLERIERPTEDAHHFVAIDHISLPPYYSKEMDLHVEIDRGDVWYDFPYDAEGNPVEQPVARKPTLTLFVRYLDQDIPLVHYRTTIGGWRVVREQGRDWWRYKESPAGERVWSEIVSAPVWLPPASTPPSSLVTQVRRNPDGTLEREINRNIVGPSYASAFGLVAAYHRRFTQSRGGRRRLGRDERIRTHGTADYSSPWRRASLGCHRLHNHRALRLFSTLLANRPHRQVGHRPVFYRIRVRHEDFRGQVHIDRSGYIFELGEPVRVNVLPGRIRGKRQTPPGERIPHAPGPPSAPK